MEPCPPGKEESNFQFQLFSSLRLFAGSEFQNQYINQSNVIACSNKHGLLFIGTPTGFQIVNFYKFVAPNAVGNASTESTTYPRREYTINAKPTYIGLNCDETLLAIAVQNADNMPSVRVYKIASLTQQSKNKVVRVVFGQLQGTCLVDFSWNPVSPELLAVCVSDGSLHLYSHDENGNKIASLVNKAITCISWSPKGKQLLVGDRYGNIIQYKPDLKEPFKIVAPPQALYPNACMAINLIWLSVYQYGVVYGDANSQETSFVIVNAPKAGSTQYVNYDELCYNSSGGRSQQFYFVHLPVWNVLILASSNSTEVSVLHLLNDKVTWEQWLQEDNRRIDLPLDKNKVETYPIGLALAVCSQLKIGWSDNQFLEPMPTLSILSNDGLMSMYHVINIAEGASPLCHPCEPLPDQMFVTESDPSKLKSSHLVKPSPTLGGFPQTSQPSQEIIVSPLSQRPNVQQVNALVQNTILQISNQSNAQNTSLVSPFGPSVIQSATGPPLVLAGKPQISITPVLPTSPSPVVKPSETVHPSSALLFQKVADSMQQQQQEQLPPPNVAPIAEEVSSQTTSSIVGPTIVINSLPKQKMKMDERSGGALEHSVPVTSKPKSNVIRKEELQVFVKLETSITELLKSYKLNLGNKHLTDNLCVITKRVQELDNFFVQLEDSIRSLSHDIACMKRAQNETFVYAHECKRQMSKFERKKMDAIMIGKKSINPIIEKQLLAIENNLIRTTSLVMSCKQNARPFIQHLDIVKSGGTDLLNFQSILQSVNKEKLMISKCSIMLEEINRDVMRFYNRNNVTKCANKVSQRESAMRAAAVEPQVELFQPLTTGRTKTDLSKCVTDKYKNVKQQVQRDVRMSTEKLNKLKCLHTVQVLEPIRYSELKCESAKSNKGLAMSDMIKLFKSPPTSSSAVKPNGASKTAHHTDVNDRTTTPDFLQSNLTTPLVSKTKSATPNALFDGKTFGVPSPVVCEKPPELDESSATAIVIDMSRAKPVATKLTFEDSVAHQAAAVGTKNLFTSTPAVSSATGKAPPFGLQTPFSQFGTKVASSSDTFSVLPVATKSSEPFTVSPVSSKTETSSLKGVVPSSASSAVVTTKASPFMTAQQPPSFGIPSSTSGGSFVNASVPASLKVTPFSFTTQISTASTTTTTPAFSFSTTSTKSLFSTSVSTTPSAATTSEAPFKLTFAPSSSTSSKLPFGTPPFISPSTIAPSSALSDPPVLTIETTTSVPSTSLFSDPPILTPSVFIGQLGTKTSSSSPFSGFAPMIKSDAAQSSKTSNKFDFTSPTPSFSAPAAAQNKSEPKIADKKVEDSAAKDTPFGNFSLQSLLATSSSLKVTTSEPPSLSQEDTKVESSQPVLVSTAAAPVVSQKQAVSESVPTPVSSSSDAKSSPMFAASVFGNAQKTSGFSFINAAAAVSSPTSTDTTVTTTSASIFGMGTFSSVFATSPPVTSAAPPPPVAPTTPTNAPSVFSTPPVSSSDTAPSTSPTSSSTVLPTTPTKPSIFGVPSSTAQPTTPIANGSSQAPSLFATTPTSSSVFPAAAVTSSSGFPSTPTTTSTAPSLFGTPQQADPKTSQAELGNLFGSNLSFGGSSPSTQNTNVFGQSGGNLFSQSSTFGKTSGNIFAQGAATPPQGGNIFGQPAATSSGSLFGQTPASTGNVFAKSGSLFGDSAAKTTSVFGSSGSSSVFGQSNTNSSFGSSTFGGFGGNTAKTESSSFFGQNSFASPATTSSSVFGQSSPFSQTASSSAFGANTSAFGAKPSFGQAGGSIFGGNKSNFGQTGGSIFGSAGGSPNTSGGSIFGSGGGSASVFGAPSTFGQSTFGQPAAFGAAPAFGSAPAFGGTPAFGSSPTKIFGASESSNSGQPTAGFGMAAASQNFDSLSFGNLAQQQTSQTGFGSFGQAASSGFGSQSTFQPQGGSFSSWR